MDARYILEKSSVGTRVGGADFNCRAGRSVLRDSQEKNGPVPAYTNGPVLYKFVIDGGSAAEVKGEGTYSKGNGFSPVGRILHDVEKVSVAHSCLRVRNVTLWAGKVNCTAKLEQEIKPSVWR